MAQKMVGGCHSPAKGTQHLGLPVSIRSRDAVEGDRRDVSVIYVPAPFARIRFSKQSQRTLKLVVCITEGIPTLDMLAIKARLSVSQRAWSDRTAPA